MSFCLKYSEMLVNSRRTVSLKMSKGFRYLAGPLLVKPINLRRKLRRLRVKISQFKENPEEGWVSTGLSAKYEKDMWRRRDETLKCASAGSFAHSEAHLNFRREPRKILVQCGHG